MKDSPGASRDIWKYYTKYLDRIPSWDSSYATHKIMTMFHLPADAIFAIYAVNGLTNAGYFLSAKALRHEIKLDKLQSKVYVDYVEDAVNLIYNREISLTIQEKLWISYQTFVDFGWSGMKIRLVYQVLELWQKVCNLVTGK